MNVEKGVMFWDFEIGLVNDYYLYPREFNYTYHNIGGDVINTKVSYTCNCGDYGDADKGSNYT
jgi:hypothetical protein